MKKPTIIISICLCCIVVATGVGLGVYFGTRSNSNPLKVFVGEFVESLEVDIYYVLPETSFFETRWNFIADRELKKSDLQGELCDHGKRLIFEEGDYGDNDEWFIIRIITELWLYERLTNGAVIQLEPFFKDYVDGPFSRHQPRILIFHTECDEILKQARTGAMLTSTMFIIGDSGFEDVSEFKINTEVNGNFIMIKEMLEGVNFAESRQAILNAFHGINT